MKKYFFVATMCTLFIIGLSSMVSMNATPYDCQSDCDELVAAGIFSSHGTCMSACRTCTNQGGGATPAVCICKIAQALGDPFFAENNFGKCVNLLKGN